MTETNQTMGKRIMSLRKQAGMTQEQLAEHLGVSPQAVSKWENDVSCPDIGTLPKLAEVFGVTTDVLLGVQSTVTAEKEPYAPKAEVDYDVDSSSEKRHSKFHGLGFSFLLIIIGAAYLISNITRVNLPFDLWSIAWPAMLLGCGIAWGIQHRSAFLFGVAFLGLYYLLAALGSPLPFELSWSVIWPLGLVLLGISMITRKFFPSKPKKFSSHTSHTTSHAYSEENGFINCDLSFGSDNIAVTAPLVCGGNIDVSFGECTMDFTRCGGFADNAKIDIDVSFGNCKILLPSTVRAVSTVGSSFGSMEIKGQSQQGAKPIYIDGDVSFGSAEIQYH